MPDKTSSYREALLESLKDPIEAKHYLNAAINDSTAMFLKALKNVAQAKQMAKVARDAGVARENLYRSLSGEGNPTVDTLVAVLKAVGFKLDRVTDLESSDATTLPPVVGGPVHALHTSPAGGEVTIIEPPKAGGIKTPRIFISYGVHLSGGFANTYANLAHNGGGIPTEHQVPIDNLIYARNNGLGQEGSGSIRLGV